MLQELEKAYQNWKDIEDNLILAKSMDVMDEPKPPTRIENGGDWEDYSKALDDYNTARVLRHDKILDLESKLYQAWVDVLKAIPIRNCLFKIKYQGSYYGLCSYYDINDKGIPRVTWNARPWTETLEPEPDMNVDTGAI